MEFSDWWIETGQLLTRVYIPVRSAADGRIILEASVVHPGDNQDDQLLMVHNVVSRPNTELLFRVQSKESYKYTGKLTVDDGVYDQQTPQGSFSLPPKAYFPTVSFGSLEYSENSYEEDNTASYEEDMPYKDVSKCASGPAKVCFLTAYAMYSSTGMGTLQHGGIDILLHRRLLQTDERGLEEPLNDRSEISVYMRLERLCQKIEKSSCEISHCSHKWGQCVLAYKRRVRAQAATRQFLSWQTRNLNNSFVSGIERHFQFGALSNCPEKISGSHPFEIVSLKKQNSEGNLFKAIVQYLVPGECVQFAKNQTASLTQLQAALELYLSSCQHGASVAVQMVVL